MENISIKNTNLDFERVLTEASEYSLSEKGRLCLLESNFETDRERVVFGNALLREFYTFFDYKRHFSFHPFTAFDDKIKFIEKSALTDSVEMYRIAFTIKGYFSVKGAFNLDDYPELSRLFSLDDNLNGVYRKILDAIDEDGYVKDNASKELSRVRKEIDRLNLSIDNKMKFVHRKASNDGYLASENLTVRDGMQCIPVSVQHKNRIEGIPLDYSSTGQTVFIVPSGIVELQHELLSLKNNERQEISRILRAFCDELSDYINELWIITDEFVNFDIHYSKAVYSYKNEFRISEVSDEQYIKIINGKHPFLENEAVPLDIEIGDSRRIFLITGPNSGGKTVAIKSVGLFVMMSQCGFGIPAADGTILGVFDNVFVDIGDSQSIQDNLSTFTGHLSAIKYIVDNVTDKSLVLLDELGSGTDPSEGGAFAIALVEYFITVNNTLLLTSHLSDMKFYAIENQKIITGSMEFDEVNLEPRYRLITGVPGSSHAFDIALRMGFDRLIVDNARSLMDTSMYDINNIIVKLKEERDRLQEESRTVESYKNELAKDKEQLEELMGIQKEKNRELTKQLNLKRNDFIEQYRKQFEAIVKEIRSTGAEKSVINKGLSFFDEIKEEIENSESIENKEDSNFFTDYKIGDVVRLIKNDTDGTVVELYKDSVLARFGLIKMKCEYNEIRKLEAKKEIKQASYNYESAVSLSKSLDLRGKRYDEAYELLDRFFDQALTSKTKELRIVHGKGSGALKKMVHSYLKELKMVTKYDFEKNGEYSINYGVTIVKI